jgi:hypothetical protein
MHVVLGDGEMTQKELSETLKDLWEQAGDEAFWFVVQGKSEPTTTDKNIVKFLHTNEIYYEVLTDDADAMADIYTQSQNTHVAKQLARKVVSLLNNSPEEGEEADVLALYVSDDSEAEEDRWLNTTVQAANDAGFKGFVLNDGMVEIELSGGEPEEPEPEEPPKPSKAPAKKVGAKKAAPAKETAAEVPSREELEEMDLGELKEVAANLGITLPPRTRPKTYIDHILGEAAPETPEAEVTPSIAADTTSDSGSGLSIGGVQISVEAVAAVAADMVMRRIVEALQSV